MNHLYKLTIIPLLILSASSINSIDDHHAGRCTGSAYCRACKNCNYCGHCNSGGSCGVCSSSLRKKASQSNNYTKPRNSRTYSPTITQPLYVEPQEDNDYQMETIDEIDPSFFIYYVNTKTLNVRSGPSTNYPVKHTLQFGEKVKLLEVDENQWARIQITKKYGSKITGYVLAEYLSENKPESAGY